MRKVILRTRPSAVCVSPPGCVQTSAPVAPSPADGLSTSASLTPRLLHLLLTPPSCSSFFLRLLGFCPSLFLHLPLLPSLLFFLPLLPACLSVAWWRRPLSTCEEKIKNSFLTKHSTCDFHCTGVGLDTHQTGGSGVLHQNISSIKAR